MAVAICATAPSWLSILNVDSFEPGVEYVNLRDLADLLISKEYWIEKDDTSIDI